MRELVLITDEWRGLNEELHVERSDFGATGWKWANTVAGIAGMYGCKSILDYGCGKNTLSRALPYHFDIQSYDPAIPDYSGDPAPADMVVSLDVLEHIEPGLLDNVLSHMRGLTLKIALFVVSTRASNKAMRDRRNAHVIIEPMPWWLERIGRHWRIIRAHDNSEMGYFHQWRRPLRKPTGACGRGTLRYNFTPTPGREFICLCTL